jgi:hypothetical protein
METNPQIEYVLSQIYPPGDFLDEFKQKVPRNIIENTLKPDGYTYVLEFLKHEFPPLTVYQSSPEQRIWELIGLAYINKHAFRETALVFKLLYDQMMKYQLDSGNRCHKGMPLCFLSDSYLYSGFPWLAKKYAMLTLIEDAIIQKGIATAQNTGVYLRLIWNYALTERAIDFYAKRIYEEYNNNPVFSQFPEFLLQELDNKWITNYPSEKEFLNFIINTSYADFLYKQVGGSQGKALEIIAEYLLASIPGVRTSRRVITSSTDYDIVCSMEGSVIDFRSEFGNIFICECKDWNKPADFTSFAKFCRVLDSIKAKFGILFSSKGISGKETFTDAQREQLKIFQDRGIVIVVIDNSDIEKVIAGENFIVMLRDKYDQIRLDLARK